MKASFVDLRKNSSEIISALNRSESITISYRGKPKAIMQPIDGAGQKTKAQDHQAFGLWKDRQDLADVPAHVRDIRKGRLDDI